VTAAGTVAAVLDAARRRCGSDLTEPESYTIAEHLGFRVPAHAVIRGGADVDVDVLRRFHGDRIVVKAIAPGLVHKSAAGGVRIVARQVDDVRAALDAIATTVPDPEYLVAEFVPHEGPELIVGFRRTPGFGPVLTVGAGGPLAEVLGDTAAVIPAASDEATVRGALEQLRWLGDAGRLADMVSRVSRAAAGLPEDLAELDLNPVVDTPRGWTALDAFCRLADPVAPCRVHPRDAVEAVFRPGSLGVIGVSSGENPGRVIVRNVLRAGFPADRVVVVKPDVARIEGVRCVPEIGDLGDGVDLLVVAVGASAAAAIVEDAAARGLARAAILIPGGIGERLGTEALAERVRAVADRPQAPLIVGPNCMGVRSVPGAIDTTFIPPERLAAGADAPVAPLAVISQSGAFAITRLDRFPAFRPRYLVTLGNQMGLTVGEAADFVVADPEVRVLACYVEGFTPGDGSRFLSAASRLVDRGGAVVLALGGTTARGRAAAASHTAAIASDPRVAASLAAQAGVLVAASLEEFEDLMRVAVAWHDREKRGLRVAAVTNAGFEAVAISDGLGPLERADLAPDTMRLLEEVLSRSGVDEVVAAGNPLDLTPIADDGAYRDAVAAVLDDPGVDAAVIGCVPLTPAVRARRDQLDTPGSMGRVLTSFAAHPTPWVAVVDGGQAYDALRGQLAAAGVAVFATADRAVRAVGRYLCDAPGPGAARG
jgi:acyl-CoA synthetase (NDP forming)